MFFQCDDQLPTSRKHRELIEQVLDNRLDGIAAIGLWTMAGADCQAAGGDGVIKRADTFRIILDPRVADHLAAQLVDVGLWHAPGHDCRRCPPVADGTYLFHDWFDLGYDPAEKVDITRRKRKELKDAVILNAVWARDCTTPDKPNEAKCRYCGTVVRRKDTRSQTGRRPQLDHVDPTRADGARNIVVACADCNGRKGNRTPAQADMVLQPPPPRDNVSPHSTAAESVSPHHTDAESVSPAPAAAETSSPVNRAAETTRPTSGDATKHRPNTDHTPDQTKRGVPARAMRAGAGVAGSGQGMGSSTGLPEQEPHVRSPRKRRRRGKGRSHPQTQAGNPSPQVTPPPVTPTSQWDAGPAPEVPTPGRFGSPWHGWTGPPSTVGDETDCPTHHLPEPCWKCAPPEGHPHDH